MALRNWSKTVHHFLNQRLPIESGGSSWVQTESEGTTLKALGLADEFIENLRRRV